MSRVVSRADHEDTGIEMWGGVEGSCTRVGDRYSDQLRSSGHAARIEDLDLFAGLGLRAIRYPVIWERTAPGRVEDASWEWADQRLARLRTLGLRPIVGLVHHGSGPPDTSLVHDDFAPRLARFARAVAERYPWVEDYTPVNEPVTTARFSALYGFWYPHQQAPFPFFRALLNQLKGVVLAMRAIRAVSPGARLVHTEDAGRVFSTPHLAYQAEFENLRQTLGVDLLTGRVGREHPMWEPLMGAGIPDADVLWFQDHPCPPDIVGVNYYATSDRLIDERVEEYPATADGGNGRDRYADVEAVRARPEGIAGHLRVMLDTWERYRLPVAVTEVHLGCTREEQLRWLVEAWDAAAAARRQGADVRALCAWALLGSFDWDSLLMREEGHNEPGVFDLCSPSPRPTALALAVADMARGKRPVHPVLAHPGWWRRSERLLHASAQEAARGPALMRDRHDRGEEGQPLLITGARGTLGRLLAAECRQRGVPCVALDRTGLDIADRSAIQRVLEAHRPAVGRRQRGRLRAGGPGGARPGRLRAGELRRAGSARGGLPPSGRAVRHVLHRPGVRRHVGTPVRRNRPGEPAQRLRGEQGQGGARSPGRDAIQSRHPHQRLLQPRRRLQLRHHRPADARKRGRVCGCIRPRRVAHLRSRPGERRARPALRRRIGPLAPGQRG